jgi:DNA-binding MarR family transcriptional regulator
MNLYGDIEVPLWESPEHKIAVSIRAVDMLLSKIRHNELAHLGVTPAYTGVLHFTKKFDQPPTIIELRDLMNRGNSSMVGIINRMERDGLVKRQIDSRSKKFTRVVITEKGEELYKKAIQLDLFVSIISALPEGDRQKFSEYLDILFNAAKKVLAEQVQEER